jgi:DNA gyrase subunit B
LERCLRYSYKYQPVEGGYTAKRGNQSKVVSTIDEAIAWFKTMANKDISIQRYKGLGEMNPTQLWETTMDPERRHLMRVCIDDAVQADNTFSMLMGDQVEPRCKFIEENELT